MLLSTSIQGNFKDDYELVGEVTTHMPEWWPKTDDVIIKGIIQKLHA